MTKIKRYKSIYLLCCHKHTFYMQWKQLCAHPRDSASTQDLSDWLFSVLLNLHLLASLLNKYMLCFTSNQELLSYDRVIKLGQMDPLKMLSLAIQCFSVTPLFTHGWILIQFPRGAIPKHTQFTQAPEFTPASLTLIRRHCHLFYSD